MRPASTQASLPVASAPVTATQSPPATALSSANWQAANSQPAPAIDPDWQKSLESQQFVFNERGYGFVNSLQNFQGNCAIEMIYDPARWWAMTFKLLQKGKEIATIDGSRSSSFCASQHVLYFAQYPDSTCGCRVLAFDTTSGVKLWETDLEAVGQVEHSAYLNKVALDKSARKCGDWSHASDDEARDSGTLIITGSESYGDYMEVLDMKTGATLAHKIYRSGL